MKPVRVGLVPVIALLAAACNSLGDGAQTNPVAPATSPVATTAALSAASGSVKVDSGCSSSCSDPDREDNTIEPGATADVWIVEGNRRFCSVYDYEIFDDGAKVGTGTLDFGETCGPKLRRYSFQAPSEASGNSATITLLVFCDGTPFGQDSFRLTANASCSK